MDGESQHFSVFISFKNHDLSGEPTRDRELAEGLYNALSARGVQTFFSLFTLKELGQAEYKRAINEALDQSSVLVVVCTSSENARSRWVSYEWSSFHDDILSGRKPNGTMLSYIEGITPNDLPRELRSGYQAIVAEETTAADAAEFIIRCARMAGISDCAAVSKGESSIGHQEACGESTRNFDEQMRQSFDLFFGRERGTAGAGVQAEEDPLLNLLEESYVNNYVDWLEHGFRQSTSIAHMAGSRLAGASNTAGIDATCQETSPFTPVRLVDSQGLQGKHFTIVDKQGMKTIIYEVYHYIDFTTKTVYPGYERTISTESTREDGCVERTFFIAYTEPVDLVLITLDVATHHVILNMGRLVDDTVKLSTNPITTTMEYMADNSPRPDSVAGMLQSSAYQAVEDSNSQPNGHTIELGAWVSNNVPIVMDCVTGDPVLRTPYLDEATGEWRARVTLEVHHNYLVFEVEGITRPLTEYEIGKYYVRGYFQKDLRKGIEYLSRDESAEALYEIARVFLYEDGYRNTVVADTYMHKAAEAESIPAKVMLALRSIADFYSGKKSDVDVEDILSLSMPNESLQATLLVAYCMEKGIGMPKDAERAFQLYLYSAQHGQYLPAQHRLHRSWSAEDIDEQELWHEFEASTRHPNGIAEFCIGSPLVYGSWSFERDPEIAAVFLRKSAQEGCLDACAELWSGKQLE